MDEKQIRAAAEIACRNTLEHLRAGRWSMQSVCEEIQSANSHVTWPDVSGMAMALAIYAAE